MEKLNLTNRGTLNTSEYGGMVRQVSDQFYSTLCKIINIPQSTVKSDTKVG